VRHQSPHLPSVQAKRPRAPPVVFDRRGGRAGPIDLSVLILVVVLLPLFRLELMGRQDVKPGAHQCFARRVLLPRSDPRALLVRSEGRMTDRDN
jgi:hypothetical protein